MKFNVKLPRAPHFGPLPALGLLLTLAFALGGASRGDVASLAVLRPAAALLLGFGLCTLTRNQVRAHGLLFGLAVAALALTIAHLVPLPPAIWSQLPGRELVSEIDRAAGLGDVWRPLSLTPGATWNALHAQLVPLAALVLGAQLGRDDLWRLLPLLIALGLASGLLGVLQLGGAADGPLYFYRVTNGGSAVGLFANRNHQAVLLAALLPALAVWASTRLHSPREARVRALAAAAAGAFLVPLILVTGSRAGLAAGAIGLAGALLLYRPPGAPGAASRRAPRATAALVAVGAAALGLGVLTVALGRGEAYDRLVGQLAEDEGRLQVWGPTLDLARAYFPWGSGLGSFVEVYQAAEPSALLGGVYFNHAHSDWLELLLTGGLPAALLLAVAVGALAWRARRLADWRRFAPRDRLMAWLGLLIIILLAAASVADYPLRVPSLASLLVIAGLWVGAAKPISSDAESV